MKYFIRPEDLINPIAVKELRQAVKGRSIGWALIIFLIIQLAIIGIVLMMATDLGEDFSMGRNIFMGLLSVLLAVTLFFVPAFTAIRFSSERAENDVDLFFITTLKPYQIIWGKFSAAIILTLLFFSASLPFMTLTYLLRGLDLPSVFILLVFDFLVVAGCIQFGIFLASLPGKLMARIFRFIFALFLMFGVYELAFMASYGIMRGGVGSVISSWDFWGTALTIVAVILIGTGLLFVIATAIITPVSANRALPVRVYLFFTWLVTGIITAIWFLQVRTNKVVTLWALFMVVSFSIHLFVTICERQFWQPRVARTIPKNIFLRIPAFILYSGAAGGIVFTFIMLCATVFAVIFLIPDSLFGVTYRGYYSYMPVNFSTVILILPLYALCYSLTAFNLKNIFFKRITNPACPVIIAMILLACGCLLPVIFAFIFNLADWERLSSRWFIANPFVLFFDRDIWVESLLFTGIWAVIIGLATIPWIVKQAAKFKPLPETKNQTENG